MIKTNLNKIVIVFSLVIITAGILFFTTCNQQKTGKSNNEVEKVEAGGSIDYGQKMLIEQMNEDIELADEYILNMESKLDVATQSERVEIESAIEAIKNEKQNIATQRHEVSQSTKDTWQIVKNDIEKSITLSMHTIDSLVKNTEKP